MFDQTSTSIILTHKAPYNELTDHLAVAIKLETTSIELTLAAIEPKKEYVAKEQEQEKEQHSQPHLEYDL